MSYSSYRTPARRSTTQPTGSKDLADAVAGVCTTLMGDRMYHKGVTSRPEPDDEFDREGDDVNSNTTRETSAF